MKNETSEIEQVVVTGYQTIDREKSTGAVTSISAAALEDRYTPSLRSNLEGRIAGLTVYDGKMTIRGASSLSASTTPLLVVDGLPIEGSLDDLNPYDVESVTVLKDASATAIYGARASNGIIVVTTKRAREHGRVSVDVSANFTIFQKRNLDYTDNFYMTPEQQIDAERKFYQYYYSADNTEVADPIATTDQSINTYGQIKPVQYAYYLRAKNEITDAELNRQMDELKKNNFAKEYADHVLLNRFLQQYNVAVRSRSDKFQSNLVVNYRHDNTGIRKAGSNQFTVFYKGAYDMVPWLTANFSVNGILGKSTTSNSTYATDPYNVPSYTRLFEADGSHAYSSPFGYSLYNPDPEKNPEKNPALRSMKFNHLQELSYDQTTSDRVNARYHGELLFKVLPGLTANTQFIYETERQTTRSYSEAESYIMRILRNLYTVKEGADSYSYLIPENGGRLATTHTRSVNWTARGQLNFYREFGGKHALNLLAGMEFRQTKSDGTRGLLLGYDDQLQTDATSVVNFKELSTIQSAGFFMMNYPLVFFHGDYFATMGPVTEQLHRYTSGYANVTYTHGGRYNVFGSFRKDYADIYGLDTKFRGKPLWSVGASWNIYNEAFMEGIKEVNYLQFRTSYGVTGNIYQGATSRMTATSGLNTSTGQPMSVIPSPANPELKWEETATTNAGLDFRLLDNRLRGSVDYYHKKGTDIFSRKTLEPTNGFSSIVMNFASLKNNGVEVTLAYDWFRKPDGFSWHTQLTGAYNKNEITRVEVQATSAEDLIRSRFQVGYPVSAVFSYRFAGMSDKGFATWYNDEDEAMPATNDLTIDAAVFSGQSDPKTVWSMENQFKYRGVSLNVLMVYYGGHVMRARQIIPQAAIAGPVVPEYFVNAWTPDNTDTNVPVIKALGGDGYDQVAPRYANIFVHPADFLKIRNVVLGYDLPASFLSKIGLREATLRFQVDNPKPLWLKNKVDVDPETVNSGDVDSGLHPVRVQASYIFGINFNF
jgi:TonB-linked SusC/RagA family outer membrane protein